MKNTILQLALLVILIFIFFVLTNTLKINKTKIFEDEPKTEVTHLEEEVLEEDVTPRDAVYNLMKSYNVSMNSLNLEKALAHFSSSPDFRYFSNGKMLNYEEFSEGLASTFSTFESIEGDFDTIYIQVIKPDVVTVIAPFREVITDKNQNKQDLKGTVSLTAVKEAEEWKFVSGSTFR